MCARREHPLREPEASSCCRVFPLSTFLFKDYLEKSLEETKELIRGQNSYTYEPKRVYITFNTEEAQRRCLKAVETGARAEPYILPFSWGAPRPACLEDGSSRAFLFSCPPPRPGGTHTGESAHIATRPGRFFHVRSACGCNSTAVLVDQRSWVKGPR